MITAFQIIEEAYHDRGGLSPHLPGSADATGNHGRADFRLAVDAAGELYLLSKTDGFIRAILGAVIDADFDASGQVDGADFLLWQRGVGATGVDLPADADRDDDVDADDLVHWQQQFGQSAGAAAVVPEPGALLLALIGAMLIVRLRHSVSPDTRPRTI